MSFLNGSDKLKILRNGQKLFYERKYKLANKEFERYLDIYGYDEEVMKMKVICYLFLKEYKNAKNYCDRILRRDHLNEFALINKGHAFNELEKYDYALKALEIATYYYPYNPDAWCNKGRTFRNNDPTPAGSPTSEGDFPPAKTTTPNTPPVPARTSPQNKEASDWTRISFSLEPTQNTRDIV